MLAPVLGFARAIVLGGALAMAAGLLTAPAYAAQSGPAAIIVGENAGHLERLAAREVQRYLYHLTGEKLEIRSAAASNSPRFASIVIGQFGTNSLIRRLVDEGLLPGRNEAPGPEGFVIRSVDYAGRPILAVMGSDDSGSLYGSYELLEHYGARFYIGRDVLPESRTPFTIRPLNIAKEPAVRRRGLLPWHDFLNGPSGYSYEDFTSYIDQLVKLKMNTLVLHNYGGAYPDEDMNEPFMDFECNGARPDSWLDTSIDNQRWGLAPSYAGDLTFRSGDYLPYDVLGSDAARYTRVQPQTHEHIVAKAKAMMQRVIRYAQARGVEVVLGTDFDVLPASMRAADCDPLDPSVLRARIDDILASYPTLKYIQMYFNEVSGTQTEEAIEAYRFMRDYLAEKRPEARLVTGSWFQESRFPQLHAALPRDIVFSTLLPHDMTVRQEWAQVAAEREAWPVPWMEFDGGLSEPQLAVGRMAERLPRLRDAGVGGVIGILWREMPAEVNVAYLAQDLWRRPGDVLPAQDFYRDYAAHIFGEGVAEQGAQALEELEKGGVYPGVGALRLTTPEYFGWSGWADPSALSNADHYQRLESTFRALSPLVTTPSGRRNLEFYIEWLRWLREYWTAQHNVPAAAVRARPRLANYFLVDAGSNEPEKDLAADFGYYGGPPHNSTTSGVVENDFGYSQAIRSERWSSETFGYRFDIPEGFDRYRVELYFQEGHFGVNVPGDPVGKRVFDIAINDSVVADNFDIAREAGGSLKGIRLSFDIATSNRVLDIQFRSVVSNPKVDIIRAYPIDASGKPLPEEYEPGQPAQAWEDLKNSGFREAIDAYQHMVRDLPSLGGLVSAAGGRWYTTASDCRRCARTSYTTYERQVFDELPVAPPDAFVVYGTTDGALLAWRARAGSDSTDIVGYHVYRRTVADSAFHRVTSTPITETSYHDTVDGEVVYAVTAVGRDGTESPYSYEESVAAGRADHEPPHLLLLPRNLMGTRGEPLPVTVIAVDQRAPTHVRVTLHYRRLGERGWHSVPMRHNSLARPYAFFADVPAAHVTGETIEYYVSASDGHNASYAPAGAPRLTASAVIMQVDSPVPEIIRNVEATWDPEARGVMLRWPSAGPETHTYAIYRSTTRRFEPDRSNYVTYVPAQQCFFLDVNVEPGATYRYRIQPANVDGRSASPSKEVAVRIPTN
ncbi:MAG TPA: malectin domain-containing carbohydrate-binding protein [Longimicrobiaceae bacterium]